MESTVSVLPLPLCVGKIEIDVVDQGARIFTLTAHNGQIAQREDRVGRRIGNRLGYAHP